MKDYLLGLVISISAIFVPIKELFLVTLVLIVVDLISGMLAARKKGLSIRSAGIRRTVSKLLVYFTAIGVGFLIEQFMLEGFIPVSKIAAGLISVVEGKSIFENLDTINGSPVFKALVQKLGSVNDIQETGEKAIEEQKKDEESL